MATIQQLQSLTTLYCAFSKDDSLEATVARERIVHLMERTEQIIKDRAFLRDERRLLRMTTATIDNRKASLATMRRSDWLPTSGGGDAPASEIDRLVVDVAGVRFEIPHHIARRDANSLLNNWIVTIKGIEADESAASEAAQSASLSYTASNNSYRIVTEKVGYLSKNNNSAADGDMLPSTSSSSSSSSSSSPPSKFDSKILYVVQIDRDWWLFRYIVTFLRDGRLPDDRGILSQLYREAAFYHLSELQRAIEDQKLHLRTDEAADKDKDKKWWKILPSWLDKVEEQKAADKKMDDSKADDNKSGKDDWWLDTAYKGKTFLPLSKDPEKVVTKVGDNDALPSTSLTWETASAAAGGSSSSSSQSNNYSNNYNNNNILGGGGLGRNLSSQFLRGDFGK